MWELEAQASAMAWDWDPDDIDPDDDDGKLWVPVTAQTLKTGPAEEDRGHPPTDPATPARQMTVYVVQKNKDGSAEQASMPMVMPIMMPQMKGQVVIKANLGRGESPREEETTVDEDGEREMSEPREPSEAPALPCNQATKIKGKMPRERRTRVPKQAGIFILAEARTLQCDWCHTKGIECFSRTKGGELLQVCVGCHKQKLLCRTGGTGGHKKMGKVPDKKDTESSASNEEREESGEESGKEWLAKFSTMKVGPPKSISHATG